jgi:hypothetical protein
MWSVPAACLIAIIIALRVIWPSPPKESKPAAADAETPAREDTALTEDGVKENYAAVAPSNEPTMREAGEARGDYKAP